MTTLNSALNFHFASAEGARLAYAERGAEETVAAQLRQAATADELKAQIIRRDFDPGILFIKGSNGMHLEKLNDFLAGAIESFFKF